MRKLTLFIATLLLTVAKTVAFEVSTLVDNPEHLYFITNGNNVKVGKNAVNSNEAGRFAFYAVEDEDVDNAYYIYSLDEKKWFDYEMKASYGGTKNFVKLSSEKGNYFVIESCEENTAYYQIRPYNSTGVASIYLNYFQGADGRNTIGLWTADGDGDAGSRWNFIEAEEVEYSLTDMAGNTYKWTSLSTVGVNPTLPGAAGATFEGTWVGNKYTATINFPFPVSKEGGDINATTIASVDQNKKWRATDNEVIMVQTSDYEANDNNWLWAIYPQFDNGAFSFKIKSLGKDKWIYTEAIGSKVDGGNNDDSAGNAAGAVTLADNGTAFDVVRNGSNYGFHYKVGNNNQYLSINSRNDTKVYLGVHTGLHVGSDVFFNKVKTISPVAKIGDTPYYSLAAAVEAAQAGAEIVVVADIADVTVDVTKNLTISGTATLNNVGINANGADALTVRGLTFTGNSWINSGTAEALTVSGITATVAPSNTSYTNSRSAFISLGRSEGQELALTVENSNITVTTAGVDAILGWAKITAATITGNVIKGSDNGYFTQADAIKFMSIADGAEFVVNNNEIYSNYNGIVFAQNTTRDNAYSVSADANKFYGGADHIWIEISGGNTVHATFNATSANTVNGNAFTAADIKYHSAVIKNWTSYAGVDVVTDANGKVIGGTLASYSNKECIAEGYELGADGVVGKAFVAEVNGTKYATLSEAFAAVTDDTQDVVVLKDVTENLTSTLRGNITTENGAKVTITLTNSDWVYCNYTFVIGANVTLKVPALFYYAGGTQINGTVIANAYYQRYGGTKLTINEPGSMTVTTEQFYLRYVDGDANAGIYINGDNKDETIGLNLAVAYFYQGMINAKNANIKAGTYWQTNETDGQGSANLVLDNSKLVVSVYDHPAKATGNSNVTLTNGSVFDAKNGGFIYGDNTTLSVDATSKIIGKGDVPVQLPVATINGKNYPTLQAAIDAVQNGETITFLADIAENVTLTEKTGLYYTIDGNGKTMKGSINVASLSDTNDNRRITIKNINFVDNADANVDFISSVNTNHYPRLTIEGCSFTGSGNDGDVAVRLKSSHSVVITNCTGTGLHSFIQNTSGWNLTIEGVTVTNSKSGFALGTVQGVTVKGCEANVEGYGIRLDAQYNNNAVIESNKIEAFIPVVVRKAEVNSNVTVQGANTMTATNTDGIWFAAGTSEYETNGSMPTAATGKVLLVVNDDKLNIRKAYGNYVEPVAKVGDKSFGYIEDAIAAWTNNTTLTLLDNVTLSDVITLSSQEHHYLALGTYTMTAASGKNAIEIKSYGRDNRSESGALTITADATNPGSINAGSKACIYYKYDATLANNKYDRPIIYIKGGVFVGSSNSGIGCSGHSSAQDKCATFNISGGTFNCGLSLTKAKLLISGGTFNYPINCTGGGTSFRQISGGTFKSWQFMTADAPSKFWVGTSQGNYNVGVHVDDNGYLVVGGDVVTEPGNFEASSTNYGGWSSYLQYSSAEKYGLYYTSVEEALADNKKATGVVTVYADEIDMTDINDFKGTIIIPAGEKVTITNAPADLKVATAEGHEIVETNGVYESVSTIAKVATKAELQAALAKDNIKTIVLTADIDYGTDQLAIAKAITLDLGGNTLTTRNAFGGMSIKNNPTVKNGTIVHASNTAAIKVWNATAFEDLVIDVQGKGDADKIIGGIVLQSGSTTKVGSIKNVTIKGAALTNGIETYNCGDAQANVIGAMENVTIDAQGTGLLISAPCGTATNCDIKGGVNAVEIFIKGNYSASLDLVASTVEGGVYAHDEFSSNPDIVNNGTLNFTADANTTGASAADVTLEIARAEADKVQGVLNDVMVNAKAKLNNVYYATFAEAFAAAKADDTLTLLADLSMSEILVINKAITLDGNGKKLTSTAARAINVDGADGVTIKNLTIKASGERAINVINGATNVTIDNVTATAANYTVNLAGSATNAVVTVKNSNLTGLNVVNVAAAGAKVTVTGGTLVCNDQTDVESYAALFLNENAKEATITATGVTFDIKGDSKKAHNAAADGTITIDGKTEDVEVAVAYISYGDKAYTFNSIEAAIAKAEAGETVVLLRDITASEIITINKAITLDGNGKKLTSTAGRAINVDCEGNVGIKNLTINASGERAINVIQKPANVTIDKVTATAANYTVNLAGSAANAVVTVKNSNLTGLNVVNVAAPGAQVTVDETILNCADHNESEKYAVLALNKDAKGGSIVATNVTFNIEGDSRKATNQAQDGTVTIDGATDGVEVHVAYISYGQNWYGFATLEAAIAKVKDGETIELIRDVTMSYGAREAYETATSTVVIDGNGKTLTLNQTNSDWSSFGLANDSKLVLNNMTINKSGKGATSGAWNTHAIIFSCPVEMTDVTVNNSVAVQAGAALTNVTINEANGYYGLWINGNGQTVTVNGGAIYATSGGRGIKIADQYIDAPAQVKLSVDGTVFNTAKKAAVLVSSTAGAEIAAANVNIANVAEDSENFVWVDEDWAQHFGNVVVTGDATVRAEGVAAFTAAITANGAVQAYYKTLAEALAAAKAGDTITLLQDVTENVTINKNLTIDGANKTITGMITTDGKSLKVTIKNVNFDGDNKQQYYAVKADHMYSLTIQDCTAKNYAYGFLYANRDNYNVTVKDVTVENCANYGAYASSVSGSATFENFTVKGARYGVLVANKGTRNVNFKNVTFEGAETPLYINENGTGKVTFTFEGINEMSKAEYYTSQYVNVVAAAQAGTKVCGSLNEAFTAAVTGDIVTLLSDISLTAEDAVKTTDGKNRDVLAVVNGKEITLDMNGKKISANHQSTTNAERLWAVIYVEDGAGLTVTGNGSIDVDANDNTPKVVYMFLKNGSTGYLVIENGNFHMDNSEDSMIFSSDSNTITVKGGTFILDAVASKTNGWPVFFGVKGTNTGYVNVLGGTYNYDITQQANGEVKIGSGYTVRDNRNDTWSVVTGVSIIDGQLTEYTNDETRVVEYISYKRKIAAGLWNPLYVPFEIPVEVLHTLGYEVAIFYDVHFEITDGGVIDPTSTPDLHIVKIKEGTLKANYPYLIRATQNADLNLSLELENETLYSTAAKESVEAGSTTTRFIFEGTYTKATPEELTGRADVPCYVLSSRGTFGKMATDARLSPFRVFMYVLAKDGSPVILNDVAAEAMRIRVIGESDSDTTEIKYYESDEVKSVDYIFDLQGRRVLEPQKGNLYIINGKKVIF